MKKNIVNIFIILFSVLLVFLIGIDVYNNFFQTLEVKPVIKHEDIVEEINEEIEKVDYKVELENLRTKYNNDDIVGVLSLENTSFSEIVMQSTDNDYYLEHTVYHDENWRGQTFIDFRVDINNSKKLIIYGHNSPNYILPFKVFENFYDSNYIKEHRYLYLQTDNGIKAYEIFSVYVEVSDWDYYNKMVFDDSDDYYSHILALKNNSFYDTGVEITEEDEILIIQTCSTHHNYANYENKFLLIIGKKIQI